MGRFFERYLKQHFKFSKEANTQLTFKQFSESYKSSILDEFGISVNFFTIASDYHEKDEIYGKLTIELENHIINKKYAELILFLDSHFDDISNVMKLITLRAFKVDNTYTKNLERIYGKFLN